ncbi:MAG: phosphoribosyltransferase [Nitrosarchaeum sp.]|jgi:hypoxanthine phosphoribosyltransferase|uniref:phosphoribosyltransferase n=1 Tax=Nitrosarchaeum sp. TaxID=2026886 RepID=UPI002DE9FFFD|nr:phosphoribosyltransferase [Nitrosarchaeum sp.]
MNNLSQNVTWTDIEQLTKLLSKKILEYSKRFSSISTVSRGGLVPARLLADHLGIDTILVDKNKISSDSLFVDDIYDSGKTFKKILQKVDDPSDFVYATLFARKDKKYPKQLVYAQKTKGVEYIVFPWDALEYKRFKNNAL